MIKSKKQGNYTEIENMNKNQHIKKESPDEDDVGRF